MKYLDQEKNDNFYIDKNNMLHNINKKQPLEYCEPTPGAMQDLICLCECKEYKMAFWFIKEIFQNNVLCSIQIMATKFSTFHATNVITKGLLKWTPMYAKAGFWSRPRIQ